MSRKKTKHLVTALIKRYWSKCTHICKMLAWRIASIHPPTTCNIFCSVSLNPSKYNVQISPVFFLPIHSSSALDYFLPPLHPTLTVPAQLCACFVLLPCLYMIQSSCILQFSLHPAHQWQVISQDVFLPSPHFSLLSLPCSAKFSLLLPPSPSLVSLYVLILVPLSPESLLCAGYCWTFSAFALFCFSPPTLCGLQLLVSSQDAVEHFLPLGPQERGLFDVPSLIILYTWTGFCTDFLLNRSTTHSHSFLPSFSPASLTQVPVAPCFAICSSVQYTSKISTGRRNSIPPRHRGWHVSSALHGFDF